MSTAAQKDAHPHVTNTPVSVTAVNQGSMVATVMSPALQSVVLWDAVNLTANVQLVIQDTMVNIAQSNVDIVNQKGVSSPMALVQSVILGITE